MFAGNDDDKRTVPKWVTRLMAMDASARAGLILVVCAAVALIWSNSPYVESYTGLWQTPFMIGLGEAVLNKPLILWVNDGLMAIFFLLVGLEIKREVREGALSTWRQAAMPVFAAIGGIAVPALIFVAFNVGEPSLKGWAIPAATDIAFALGLLALLGTRAPLSLKIFLTAVAVVDDLAAVAIIAVFYTETIALGSLMIAVGALAALLILAKWGVRSTVPFLIGGAILWLAVLKSGVHATVAGVALAAVIPMATPDEEGEGMLLKWEHALSPWVLFAIMPIFALANAGVSLDGQGIAPLISPVGLGVGLGLLVGKPIGITLMSFLAVKLKIADLPKGASWWQVIGIAQLAGVGFTMSLFITDLAFKGGGAMASGAKVGLLTGSALAAGLGVTILWMASGKSAEQTTEPESLQPAQNSA